MLLMSCILLGGALIIYQKSNRQLPPELLIETVKLTSEKTPDIAVGPRTNPQHENMLININSAPADSLELIPGLGPIYASRIVSYRNMHGRFQSIEDLEKTKGIGPKTIKKIAKFITLELSLIHI